MLRCPNTSLLTSILRDQMPAGRSGRATADTVIFELKLGVDIILEADGKYYVDAVTTTAGDVVHEWTEGPFDRTPRPASARSGGTPYR
jgi:hypothetical protein